MLRRLARRLIPAVLMFAALCQTAGLLAAHLHALKVIHVRCAEHGEVVELGLRATVDHHHAKVDVARNGGSEDHGDQCLQSPTPPPALGGLPDLVVVGRALRLTEDHAPRGPPRPSPLGYAPKTSPPDRLV